MTRADRVEKIIWLDMQGLNIQISSEYYKDGINWLWQILWYRPKELWGDIGPGKRGDLISGTMQYGDNGEYANRTNAEDAAIAHGTRILELEAQGISREEASEQVLKEERKKYQQ